MFWEKKSRADIARAVFDALARNASYTRGDVLGFPGSFLDREVFPAAPFLADMPYLSCLRENPNHIGCHTITRSESAFAGTQALERDLLRICAEEILRAPAGGTDGYVAPGGTECNIQALWVERNFLSRVHGARAGDLAILYSEDTHYSIPKAADLLALRALRVAVDDCTRQMTPEALRGAALEATRAGAKHLFVVLNMGTTMFGSIDDVAAVHAAVAPLGADYRIHVDAAFGGFLRPFVRDDCALSFADPRVVSVTLDGHKMLQAPYGTGIFLTRKGRIEHVCTEEAAYVPGKDFTICGSRSGANAVALWMILSAYGSEGGKAFVRELVARTDRFCQGLDALGVRYFRDPSMNVVTLRAADVPRAIAERWRLVPDSHDREPSWWKIVVMDHVRDEALAGFLEDLSRPVAHPG